MSHAGLKHGKFRKRQQCDDNAQKHNRQGNQKNRQGDFIRRFLAFCVFDHGDHPVDEGFAGIDRDSDNDAIGQYFRAARHS